MYKGKIYALKQTKERSLTIDFSNNPFNVNCSGNIKNVLVYSPEYYDLDIDSKMNYFISKLPFDKSYRVVVYIGNSPEIPDYKNLKLDYIVNAHEDSNKSFESKIKNLFKGAKYIGLEDLKSNSYEEILKMVPKNKFSHLEEIVYGNDVA